MTTWHPDLETGHTNIDRDHCEIFRQLQGVRDAIDGGAGREKAVELIIVLQKYALGHFAREEAHMRRVQCPTAEANCAAHREFSLRLDHWLDLLSFSGTPVSLLIDVHRESTAWIESHIRTVDCGLRSCPFA